MRKPPNERERIARVRALNVLDPALAQHLQSVVQVACEISGCSTSLVSFIENEREFVAACAGISLSEQARKDSICSETILSDEPLIISDVRKESRFSHDLLFRPPHTFSFYAGFPLITQDSLVIGALSVADSAVRNLSDAQVRALQMLAAHTVSHVVLNNKLAAVQRTLSSLEDSEQRFRRIADASPVLLWISDLAGNRTLSNKAWCDFTGLSQEESLAECWRDTVHPDDRAVYQAKWRECAHEHSRFQHEFRLRHQSGTYRWVMEQAIPLFSSNGRLEAYVSSCVDLSLRNSDELQYQHNEARFRAVSEAAPLGIVVTDSNGNCVYSNHKFQEIAGLTTEESLGSGWLRTVHPNDRDEIQAAWAQATKTIRPFERVFRYLRPDQSVAWCSLKTASINSTDTVSGWVSTLEDITEKRQAEADLLAAKHAAENAMHAKSQFLANMSHEIRTPLTAIIGFAEALREEGGLDHSQSHCLDVISNNGKHLLTIINQILDLSKIDAGALAIEPAPCDLVELVEEIVLMFTPTVSEKALFLKAVYEWPLPKQITTDPLRLKQVLINLVSNAIKFTSQGGITIKVSWSGTHQRVHYTISDTGIGMSEDQRSRLFTPFYQANDSMTRTFGGTGLGLSISKRLIQALGGEIEVESTPGQGSAFSFHIQSQGGIPQGFTDKVAANAEPTHPENTKPPSLSGSILFADDALDNRRLIEHLLRNTGAEVVLVENGKEALEATRDKAFDLILMDIQMPVMDGLTATQQIRQAGVTTPIVALSAGAMTSDVEKALQAGCSMHLSKPFERAVFYDVLAKFVRPATQASSVVRITPITSTVSLDDPEMRQLIADFVKRLPERLTELGSTARAENFKAVAALAHKLKGSAGMYGYPELAAAAKTLEVSAKNGDSTGVLKSLEAAISLSQQIERGLSTSSISHTP